LYQKQEMMSEDINIDAPSFSKVACFALIRP